MAIFERAEPTEPMPEFPYELIRVRGTARQSRNQSREPRVEGRGTKQPPAAKGQEKATAEYAEYAEKPHTKAAKDAKERRSKGFCAGPKTFVENVRF
jgi:hypothetical protein